MNGQLHNLLLRIKTKASRLTSFLLFGKRSAIRNVFGSYISPLETRVANDLSLHKKLTPIMDKLVAQSVNVPLIRIGSENDGGYVVIDKSYKSSFLISGGILNDNNFEIEMAKRGARGHQIDYSIQNPPIFHNNLTFSPQRLVGSNQKFFSYDVTLDEVVEDKVKNSNDKFDELILKLDIEGSEWDIIRESDYLPKFHQIMIELHYLDRLASPELADSGLSSLEKLLELFFPVFISGNNCCGILNLGGYVIPRVFEMSLLNRKYYAPIIIPETKINSLYQSQNYPTRAPLVLKKW